MTEWNPSDPEAARVFYDLGEWDFEQQAELTSSLAEAGIPHGWEGTELVVPEDYEDDTDAIFADVEQRLAVQGRAVPDFGDVGTTSNDDADADEAGDTDDALVAPAARVIDADATLTEYDLSEWDDLELELVGDSLAANNIPFRWEESILLVPTDDEATVDDILDEIESGNVIPVAGDGDDDEGELPFESLNSFFLAGERLRRDPRDADGLERLLDALKIADPNRPPRGVELRVWRRSCDLAEQLADVLVEGSDDDEEPTEDDQAMSIATDLHDLLRPLI